MPTTELNQLWRAARFSIVLTTIGGAGTYIVAQIFDVLPPDSEQYLTVNLVRSSMAVLSIFLSVFVVSVVKRSKTSRHCEISFQDLYAWTIITVILSSSVLFIEGPDHKETVLLGFAVALFIVITTLFFLVLVALVAENRSRIVAIGLLLPSCIGTFRISNPAATPTEEVLSQVAVHGISLIVVGIFSVKCHIRIGLRRRDNYRVIPIGIAVVSVALLIG